MSEPYGPPGGQPGYGPPAYPTQPYAPAGYRPPPAIVDRRANPAGIAIALIGGAIALIGTLVRWYEGPEGLKEIVALLDHPGAKSFPKAYFGWAMWVVLALTVVCAVLANLAGPMSTALRILAPIAGVIGAVLVCAGLGDLIRGQSIFDHSAAGLWLVLAGFLVAGFAGVFGPRRSYRPGPY